MTLSGQSINREYKLSEKLNHWNYVEKSEPLTPH